MRQVGVRESLYVIIFEAETPLGQAFDVTLLLLIVASVTTTCLETVHSGLNVSEVPGISLSEL